MGDKIKLDKGQAVTLRIASVETWTGNYGDNYTFKATDGRELAVPKASADRQLARHGFDVKTMVGFTWRFSKTADKGFLDIDPADQADAFTPPAPPPTAPPVPSGAAAAPGHAPPEAVAAVKAALRPDLALERAKIAEAYLAAMRDAVQLHEAARRTTTLVPGQAPVAREHYAVTADAVQATAFTLHKLWKDGGCL